VDEFLEDEIGALPAKRNESYIDSEEAGDVLIEERPRGQVLSVLPSIEGRKSIDVNSQRMINEMDEVHSNGVQISSKPVSLKSSQLINVGGIDLNPDKQKNRLSRAENVDNTAVQTVANDAVSIPYHTQLSDLAIVEQPRSQDMSESQEQVEALMTEEIIMLQVATKRAFKQQKAAHIAYRYLFWACQRGYLHIVYHVITKFGVSPFLAEKEDERSPFMTAIEHN